MGKKGKRVKSDPLKPRILVVGHATRPIERAGGSAVWISIGDQRAGDAIRLGAVDGLLLTGGGDVNPLLYSKTRDPRCYGINESRDLQEWDAITAADEKGIPILGICRGSQIINVAYGGTLHQHIQSLPQTHEHHNGGDHRVKAAKGSRLGESWGDKDEYTRWVISIHHQSVDQVAPGFVPTGWGTDGIVEAIESVESHWVVGVQFHPEMDYERHYHQRLFDSFVAAAAAKANITGFKKPVHTDENEPKPAWKGKGTEWGFPKTHPKSAKGSAAVIVGEKTATHANRSQRAAKGEPVITRWRCFRCKVDFDMRVDHVDHMLFLHGVAIDED